MLHSKNKKEKLMITYINGEYKKNASLSVRDLSILRGYGVFDFLRTYHKKPFHLNDHLQRLRHSLKKLHLCISLNDDEIKTIIQNLLKLNKLTNANIKIIVTGGISEDHLFSKSGSSIIIMVYPVVSFSKEHYEKGISLITYPHQRLLASCKSLDYVTGLLALKKAKEVGAKEALYIFNDEILEATTCNFFAFINGALVTASQNILAGITREVVLKLAKPLFLIQKRKIHINEIAHMQEAFITSSNKEIMPVRQIDQIPIPIGNQTQVIQNLFQKYTSQNSWEDLNIDFALEEPKAVYR